MTIKRNKSKKKKNYKNFRVKKKTSFRLNKKIRKNYKKSYSASKYTKKNLRGLKNKSKRVRKSKNAIMHGGSNFQAANVSGTSTHSYTEQETIFDIFKELFKSGTDPREIKHPFSDEDKKKVSKIQALLLDSSGSRQGLEKITVNNEIPQSNTINPTSFNDLNRSSIRYTKKNDKGQYYLFFITEAEFRNIGKSYSFYYLNIPSNSPLCKTLDDIFFSALKLTLSDDEELIKKIKEIVVKITRSTSVLPHVSSNTNQTSTPVPLNEESFKDKIFSFKIFSASIKKNQDKSQQQHTDPDLQIVSSQDHTSNIKGVDFLNNYLKKNKSQRQTSSKFHITKFGNDDSGKEIYIILGDKDYVLLKQFFEPNSRSQQQSQFQFFYLKVDPNLNEIITEFKKHILKKQVANNSSKTKSNIDIDIDIEFTPLIQQDETLLRSSERFKVSKIIVTKRTDNSKGTTTFSSTIQETLDEKTKEALIENIISSLSKVKSISDFLISKKTTRTPGTFYIFDVTPRKNKYSSSPSEVDYYFYIFNPINSSDRTALNALRSLIKSN